MKLILIFIPFCFCSLAELPVPEMAKQASKVQLLSDTIKWSPDYKLNVNDFKAQTYNYKDSKYDTSKYHILANASVVIGYSFKSEKGKLLFDAFAIFDRSKSWMKEPNEAVLKHEQGHFDLTEIYARKLEQAVGEIKNLEDPSFWESFQKTNQEINDLLAKEHDNYDGLTITSLGQEYYSKKLRNELKAPE